MSLWDIPAVKDLRNQFEGRQLRLDPMTYYKNYPELYAIWASKQWMVL